MRRFVGWSMAALGLLAVYVLVVRSRMLRSGATDAEVEMTFPGESIVPGGIRSATMSITIDAPPSFVWPWLAQMGVDRGGWYSWDRLDNFGRRSTHELHEEWQTVEVGDHFIATPDGSQWWEVAAVEPERFLALRMSLDLTGRPFDPRGERPDAFTDSTWGFFLEAMPGAQTRLIVSGYWSFEPAWLQPILGWLVVEPSHWVMQTKQFAEVKRRAEAAYRSEIRVTPPTVR